ncbi:MAG: ankyrin repeat domain-containing protein [Alphaproteobacteria bacterium]|nr:ankyrin repeat domain-containing protein [Alphaproteobacteria bacterium]
MARKRVIYYAAAIVLFCVSGASFAQSPSPSPTAMQEVQKELTYRVGLGRGDDVKLLLKQGANPNSANDQGLPLLFTAAARKDAEAINVVQALLESGADVNVKDKDGQTALYYAARVGNAGVVNYLLKNKIDYYSLDNNGDIARTIAFRTGHTDIVKLMDDYVKNQTLQLQTTYGAADTMLKEQQEKAAREAAEAERQQAIEEEKARKEAERLFKEYQENLKKLDGKVYNIAFHACAFEYWSFVQSSNQTISLSDAQLAAIIKNHRKTVEDESLAVMNMFNIDHKYVNQIIDPSKKAVFDQLNAMPSRTYRKENGVGTGDDLTARCVKIAGMWEVNKGKSYEPPAPPSAPPPAAIPKPAAKKPEGKPFPDQILIQPVGSAAAKNTEN